MSHSLCRCGVPGWNLQLCGFHRVHPLSCGSLWILGSHVHLVVQRCMHRAWLILSGRVHRVLICAAVPTRHLQRWQHTLVRHVSHLGPLLGCGQHFRVVVQQLLHRLRRR